MIGKVVLGLQGSEIPAAESCLQGSEIPAAEPARAYSDIRARTALTAGQNNHYWGQD